MAESSVRISLPSPRSRTLSEADVIAAHTARTYRVFMLGFVPGFAYLGIVDAAHCHAAPRDAAGARAGGSVGIAGVQTGIYPTETPGGWQLDRPDADQAVRSGSRGAVPDESRRRGPVLRDRSRRILELACLDELTCAWFVKPGC